MHDLPGSVYQDVARLIAMLIDRFDLTSSSSLVLQAYEEICKESLVMPRGVRASGHSRINYDGTPIQFAVTLGTSHHTLQFLSEAGGPGLVGRERMYANRESVAILADLYSASEVLTSVTGLLDTLAPETDADLIADHSGAYWIGTAFTAGNAPALRIYINNRWGKEEKRWVRLNQFAAYFGSKQWQEIDAQLSADMQPLGTAITLQGDKSPKGRIYLTAYGKRMDFYEQLANEYGGADFMRQVRTFGRCILGEDYVYPTQTAVCSFGFGVNPMPDFKFELCAHCAFASDAEATSRLRLWFTEENLDATDYLNMLDILSAGCLSDKALDLHCYAGIGLRRGEPYATIYLKPRLITT